MTNFYMGLIVAAALILLGLLLGMANRKKARSWTFFAAYISFVVGCFWVDSLYLYLTIGAVLFGSHLLVMGIASMKGEEGEERVYGGIFLLLAVCVVFGVSVETYDHVDKCKSLLKSHTEQHYVDTDGMSLSFLKGLYCSPIKGDNKMFTIYGSQIKWDSKCIFCGENIHVHHVEQMTKEAWHKKQEQEKIQADIMYPDILPY